MMRDSDHSTAPTVSPGTVRRPWLAIALLAGVAALCVSLGFWQLGRADERRAAAQRFDAALELPPARLRTGDDADERLRYRKVEATGRFVPDHQFLLDNVVRDRVVGYYVLTPFAPDDGGLWLMVNRGWLPADLDRRVLPDVSVDDRPRSIDGVLDQLPAPGLRLGEEAVIDRDEAVSVTSFPTIESLERALGRPLYRYQLLLDAEQPDGYARDFPAPGLAPERHIEYAVQWWLFGTIAGGAAIVIAARVLRRRT